MSQLGQLEKPTVDSFLSKRKIYCVHNFIPFSGFPEDYTRLLNLYWEDVLDHLKRLETAGKVKKVFYENVYLEGEEGLNVIKGINEKAFELIKQKIDAGALFIPIENREILGAFIDWRSCLSVVRTKEVFSKIYTFYLEVLNSRIAHIRNIIENNLQPGEASLLIMEDEVRSKIQFSPDIEVFLIRPPSSDNILRWLKDYFDKNSL